MKRIRGIVLLFIVLFGFGSFCQAEDDIHYWPRFLFKLASTEKFNYNFYAEGWLRNDAERLEVFLIGPQVQWKFSKHLNLQFNYTYLGSRGATRDDFAEQHRAEFEVNPHWSVGQWLKIQTRNRFEYRWIENNGHDNDRMRNRIQLVFPVKEMGVLKSVYCDTEIFYNFKTDKHDEQRTVPLGMNFKVNDVVDLQTFYMIQNMKTDTWKSNQIFGTMLTVKF